MTMWEQFLDLLHRGMADPKWMWIILCTVLLLGLLIAWWIRRLYVRLCAAWYRFLGRRGERIAQDLLNRAGYRMIDGQSRLTCSYQVDDEVITYGVRADFIVERDGKRYVAEAKGGTVAADPRCPATRRQLREYSVVFQAAGVLLVDVPGRRIRCVQFPDMPG